MRIKNLAFTLAEIMIVLVVIGILTGILVPAAMNSMPNGNVMKFKKAHNTLYRVINELVSSDKYYADGDLGKRPNGDLIDGTHTGDKTYFCESIADILSTKSVDCKETSGAKNWGYIDLSAFTLKQVKQHADGFCREYRSSAEIITTDGVSFFQSSPQLTFGMNTLDALATTPYDDSIGDEKYRRWFNNEWHNTAQGFQGIYKVYCIDVDGIPAKGSADCDDDKDICPFGYGIRYDGKIISGARADKWLTKSIQEK